MRQSLNTTGRSCSKAACARRTASSPCSVNRSCSTSMPTTVAIRTRLSPYTVSSAQVVSVSTSCDTRAPSATNASAISTCTGSSLTINLTRALVSSMIVLPVIVLPVVEMRRGSGQIDRVGPTLVPRRLHRLVGSNGDTSNAAPYAASSDRAAACRGTDLRWGIRSGGLRRQRSKQPVPRLCWFRRSGCSDGRVFADRLRLSGSEGRSRYSRVCRQSTAFPSPACLWRGNAHDNPAIFFLRQNAVT